MAMDVTVHAGSFVAIGDPEVLSHTSAKHHE